MCFIYFSMAQFNDNIKFRWRNLNINDYPKDKLNKSTRIICLIYFSVAQFNDKIKFRWRNLNINYLMLINLHILLIKKLFFRSFDRHSDKTVTHSELLLDINNFSKTIVHVIRKSHEFTFKIVQVITIVVSNPVNFLVNARPMTSEHCHRILDDVTIFCHLAVESTFLYSLHPAHHLCEQVERFTVLLVRWLCDSLAAP